MDNYFDAIQNWFGTHVLTFEGNTFSVIQGAAVGSGKPDKAGVMVNAQTSVLLTKAEGMPGVNALVQLDGVEMEVVAIQDSGAERRLDLAEV